MQSQQSQLSLFIRRYYRYTYVDYNIYGLLASSVKYDKKGASIIETIEWLSLHA